MEWDSDCDEEGEYWEEDCQDQDDDIDDYDPESACVECGAGSTDWCVCGNPLCHMHFEIQGGFCKKTGTIKHNMLMDSLYKNTALKDT